MNNNKMNPNARLSFLERFAYGSFLETLIL